ncbi:MAG TPA: VOC family protein [Nitriliruptorales bacterium]
MTQLREIVVEVSDVDAAARFYVARGLHERRRGRWEAGPFVALEDDDGVRLMLVEGDGGVRLALTVADAVGSLASAEADGAQRDADPSRGGGGTWAPARDPFGNAIGFWSRT